MNLVICTLHSEFVCLKGLSGKHQVQNAALAVELARSFIQLKEPNTIEAQGVPRSFVEGLVETKWPGRCQTVVDPKREGVTWYLDGAHTVESLQCCVQWFVTPGIGISAANTDDEYATIPFVFLKILHPSSSKPVQESFKNSHL